MTQRQITPAQAPCQIGPNIAAADEHGRWCRKELAHIRCGHLTAATAGRDVHRGRNETEAESVAHIVLRALGLDSAGYSDAYVFGWANGDMTLVKECAETVLAVAKRILADLTPADGGTDETDQPQTGPDEPDPATVDPAGGASAVQGVAA